MLDFGWPELLVIAIVLIVVVGPKDLPRVLRTFGRTTAKLREMAGDFRKQFDEAMREAELDDVKNLVEDAKQLDPRGEIKKHLSPLQEAGRDIRSGLNEATKPKTSTGKGVTQAEAKPEDAPKSAPPKSTPAKPEDAPKSAALNSSPAKAVEKKPAASATRTNAKASASSAAKPAAKASTAKKKTTAKPATKSKAASSGKRTNTAAGGKKNVGTTS